MARRQLRRTLVFALVDGHALTVEAGAVVSYDGDDLDAALVQDHPKSRNRAWGESLLGSKRAAAAAGPNRPLTSGPVNYVSEDDKHKPPRGIMPR